MVTHAQAPKRPPALKGNVADMQPPSQQPRPVDLRGAKAKAYGSLFHGPRGMRARAGSGGSFRVARSTSRSLGGKCHHTSNAASTCFTSRSWSTCMSGFLSACMIDLDLLACWRRCFSAIARSRNTVLRPARTFRRCHSDSRFRWRPPTIASCPRWLSSTPRFGLVTAPAMLPSDLFTFNQARLHFVEVQAQFFLKRKRA